MVFSLSSLRWIFMLVDFWYLFKLKRNKFDLSSLRVNILAFSKATTFLGHHLVLVQVLSNFYWSERYMHHLQIGGTWLVEKRGIYHWCIYKKQQRLKCTSLENTMMYYSLKIWLFQANLNCLFSVTKIWLKPFQFYATYPVVFWFSS